DERFIAAKRQEQPQGLARVGVVLDHQDARRNNGHVSSSGPGASGVPLPCSSQPAGGNGQQGRTVNWATWLVRANCSGCNGPEPGKPERPSSGPVPVGLW